MSEIKEEYYLKEKYDLEEFLYIFISYLICKSKNSK